MRSPPHRPRLRRFAFVVSAMFLALMVVDVLVRVGYYDQVLPNTNVDGLAVGGTGDFELRQRVRRLDYGSRTVAFLHGGRRLSVTATEAGVRFDPEGTAHRAMDAGRDGPLLGIGATVTGLLFGRSISPDIVVDESALQDAVKRLASRVDRPAFPGDLDIDPATGEVGVVPPQPGERLDRRALESELKRAFLRRGDVSPPCR